jgi:hypothetical protein
VQSGISRRQRDFSLWCLTDSHDRTVDTYTPRRSGRQGKWAIFTGKTVYWLEDVAAVKLSQNIDMVRRWFAHKLQFATHFSNDSNATIGECQGLWGTVSVHLAFVRASYSRPLLEHDYTPASTSHLCHVGVRNSNDWHFTRRCSFSSVRSTAAISRPLC